MALILEANYSKKIGLPGYSSHQFSLTLKTEIADPAQARAESTRLYGLLQTSVDNSLQQVGWLPEGQPANANGQGSGDQWTCSDKQRRLIEKLVAEHRLDKNQLEQLAGDRFGKGIKQLNKLEASGLIDELFEKYGNPNQRRRFNGHAHSTTR